MDPSSEPLLEFGEKPLPDDDAPLDDSGLPPTRPKFAPEDGPWRDREARSRTRTWTWTRIILGSIAAVVLLGGSGRFACDRYLRPTLHPPPTLGLSPPWYPSPRGGTAQSWAESYKKAAAMVGRMSLPEKVNITTGTGWMMGSAVGNTGPAVHVGFPSLALQDGPLGLRFADNATAFPAGITVGATWNRHLMYERGRAHGLEARLKGINALLGPSVGPLGRMPAGGRNWEGFGADPYLQGVAGAETVRGIQSRGVMATIKHLVANEQEHFRQGWEWGLPDAISSNVPDRAMHELYAWPFANAVRAGVASVMCSYNQINSSYACANSKLINGILKDELGFQGFVMSDWLGTRSGVASALAGLDMTMPGDGLIWAQGESLWGPRLTEAVLNGSLPLDRLDDMATRIVAAWYQLGQDDSPDLADGPNFSSWTNDPAGVAAPGSPTDQDVVTVNRFVQAQADHDKIARQIAVEGTILLKNEGAILPLRPDGRSGRRSGDGTVTRVGIFGEDAGPGRGPNFCKDRGCNQGTLGSGWGSGAVEFPYLVPPADGLAARFDPDRVRLTTHVTDNRLPFSPQQPGLLYDQDICIVFANSDAGEGYLTWSGTGGDRNDLSLQLGGDDLISLVANNCGGAQGPGDTIVVIHAVGPVIMERWIDLPGVKAVVLANLPGQESGSALADVLFGDANPSGKLPYTIGRSLCDYGPGGQIMYRPNGLVPQQDFSEGLYIDYRHFDKHAISPRFEFGYGLSYTRFKFSEMVATEVRPKSATPSPRPDPDTAPPEYNTTIPDRKVALFPAEIRRLEKYIYPYLDSVDDIKTEPAYPYPDGYDRPAPLSAAGGGVGGNPDLWETHVRLSVDVTNIGDVAGQVVAQLYLSYPAAGRHRHGHDQDGRDRPVDVDFPVRVLRGFEKVRLGPGETQTVRFEITRRDLSYWDVERQNWVMVTAGKYRFAVGESSRDARAETEW